MSRVMLEDGRTVAKCDYNVALAIGMDAANRRMAREGRKQWDDADSDLAAELMNQHLRRMAE